MKNVEDLKNEMDLLINRLEVELDNVKCARGILNSNQISLQTAIKKNDIKEKFITGNTNILQKDIQSNTNKDKTSKGKQGRRRKDIPQFYPYNGTETDKVRFILHQKNRAVSETEFYDEIKKNEGPDSKSLEKLDRTLRGETHPTKGRWTYFQFANRGVKFYILPEWKDRERKTMIFQYRADVTLSGLDVTQCNWNNLIWHQDK